jgi:3-hydroxyisobutyrate dehydrogenase
MTSTSHAEARRELAPSPNHQQQQRQESTTVSTIAFFGLGNMGLPMATNLQVAGHEVRGFDPVPAAVEAATAAGISIAGTPAEACAGAEVVITMLPSGQHVLSAYEDGAGIIGTVEPGTLLIDCSTIDVADSRAAHGLAAAAGLVSVDAPVSGGVVGATQATLTFMAGGTDEAVDLAEPVLESMGKRILRCGDPSAGQAAKMCNNMLLAISMIGVSEAFVLGETLGLDHQALFDVISTSSGYCWAANVNCPVPGPVPTSPANRDFAGGFATALMTKDLRLANGAAAQAGVDVALGKHALDIYEALNEQIPDRDFSVVINAIRERSGA